MVFWDFSNCRVSIATEYMGISILVFFILYPMTDFRVSGREVPKGKLPLYWVTHGPYVACPYGLINRRPNKYGVRSWSSVKWRGILDN